MKNLTVFVACHKPCEVRSNEMYQPIHVGRKISTCKGQMNMIGDDTGDNISEKNRYYSELTAQYWAWKNYHESEYIGFCHYRRYFADYLTSSKVLDYFKKGADVIVTGPYFRSNNRWNFLKTFVCSEDLTIMQQVIKRLHPDYYKTMSKFGNDFIDYPLNMFICKRELFEEYAKWLFSILFECEKYVLLSPYSRARRLYGYLSEFLMPVFFIKNGYRMAAVPYFRTDDQMNVKGMSFHRNLKRYALKAIYSRENNDEMGCDLSVLLGLKNDGIDFINK